MTQARRKRSITIAKHRTSISLEEPFWEALCAYAEQDGRSVADLVGEIDKSREKGVGRLRRRGGQLVRGDQALRA